MNKEHILQSPQEANPSDSKKAEYSAPHVHVYGPVRALTQGTGGSKGDGTASMTRAG